MSHTNKSSSPPSPPMPSLHTNPSSPFHHPGRPTTEPWQTRRNAIPRLPKPPKDPQICVTGLADWLRITFPCLSHFHSFGAKDSPGSTLGRAPSPRGTASLYYLNPPHPRTFRPFFSLPNFAQRCLSRNTLLRSLVLRLKSKFQPALSPRRVSP